MDYWKNRDARAEHAREHTARMEMLYGDRITKSIKDSIILTDNASYIRLRAGTNYLKTFIMDPNMDEFDTPDASVDCDIYVQDVADGAFDVDKVMSYYYGYPNTTTVLNFASSINPGGFFMQGSSAQEESLCHHSTLYNVLASNAFVPLYENNRKSQRDGLFQDRGIWTPNVIITDDAGVARRTVNVLTLPAPNLKAVHRAHGDREVANEVFRRRMRMLIDFVNIIGQRGLVLGAWGCGAFGWPASWVANMMQTEMARFAGNKIRLSIIDRPTADIFKNNLIHVPLRDGEQRFS